MFKNLKKVLRAVDIIINEYEYNDRFISRFEAATDEMKHVLAQLVDGKNQDGNVLFPTVALLSSDIRALSAKIDTINKRLNDARISYTG